MAKVQAAGVAEFSLLVMGYCLTVAALFLMLWLYYDRRDHARFEAERRRTTFHCVRCDHVFAVTGKHVTATCQKCGHENARLRF